MRASFANGGDARRVMGFLSSAQTHSSLTWYGGACQQASDALPTLLALKTPAPPQTCAREDLRANKKLCSRTKATIVRRTSLAERQELGK